MYLNTLLQYLYFVFTSTAGKYFVFVFNHFIATVLYLYLNTFGEYFAQVCLLLIVCRICYCKNKIEILERNLSRVGNTMPDSLSATTGDFKIQLTILVNDLIFLEWQENKLAVSV